MTADRIEATGPFSVRTLQMATVMRPTSQILGKPEANSGDKSACKFLIFIKPKKSSFDRTA
jgi:hypothetical protein